MTFEEALAAYAPTPFEELYIWKRIDDGSTPGCVELMAVQPDLDNPRIGYWLPYNVTESTTVDMLKASTHNRLWACMYLTAPPREGCWEIGTLEDIVTAARRMLR